MQLLSSSILLDLGKKFRFYVNCETNSKKQKKSSEYSDIKSKSVKSFAFLMLLFTCQILYLLLEITSLNLARMTLKFKLWNSCFWNCEINSSVAVRAANYFKVLYLNGYIPTQQYDAHECSIQLLQKFILKLIMIAYLKTDY